MATRNWVESKFERVSGRWGGIYATMNPGGHIFISLRTFELMGTPDGFHLLYDKANATIGVKPTRKIMKNAYPALCRSGHGGRVIRAYSFIQEFGIRLHETVRFPEAEIDDDGILILDLRRTASCAKLRKQGARTEVRSKT